MPPLVPVASTHVLHSLARWPLGLLVLSRAFSRDLPHETLGIEQHETSPLLIFLCLSSVQQALVPIPFADRTAIGTNFRQRGVYNSCQKSDSIIAL